MSFPYQILFRLDLQHDYFFGDAVNYFLLIPTTQTQIIMTKYNWHIRRDETGFLLIAKADKESSPLAEERQALTFILRCKNEWFNTFTEGAPLQPNSSQKFYFDNLDAPGKWVEGEEPKDFIPGNHSVYLLKVIEDDFNYSPEFPMDSQDIGIVKFYFVSGNTHDLGPMNLSNPWSNDWIHRYIISFQSRKTFWTYKIRNIRTSTVAVPTSYAGGDRLVIDNYFEDRNNSTFLFLISSNVPRSFKQVYEYRPLIYVEGEDIRLPLPDLRHIKLILPLEKNEKLICEITVDGSTF